MEAEIAAIIAASTAACKGPSASGSSAEWAKPTSSMVDSPMPERAYTKPAAPAPTWSAPSQPRPSPPPHARIPTQGRMPMEREPGRGRGAGLLTNGRSRLRDILEVIAQGSGAAGGQSTSSGLRRRRPRAGSSPPGGERGSRLEDPAPSVPCGGARRVAESPTPRDAGTRQSQALRI